MTVKIRLTRKGKKGVPYYRLVVMDERNRRDGKPIDTIGLYQPCHNPVTIKVDEDKAIKWLQEGAIPSTTVKSILRKEGILKKFHDAKSSQANKKAKKKSVTKAKDVSDIKTTQETSELKEE